MTKTREIITDYWDKKIQISVPENTVVSVVSLTEISKSQHFARSACTTPAIASPNVKCWSASR
jgi:hypothetical protein